MKNKKLLFLVAGLTIIFSTFLCLYSGLIIESIHKSVKVFKPSVIKFEAYYDCDEQFNYDNERNDDFDSVVLPPPPNGDFFPNDN